MSFSTKSNKGGFPYWAGAMPFINTILNAIHRIFISKQKAYNPIYNAHAFLYMKLQDFKFKFEESCISRNIHIIIVSCFGPI